MSVVVFALALPLAFFSLFYLYKRSDAKLADAAGGLMGLWGFWNSKVVRVSVFVALGLSLTAANLAFYWALQGHTTPVERGSAIQALLASKQLFKKPNTQLVRWDLPEYIEVAAHLDIIESDTATEARLTQHFRNLIHPGRSIRLGQVCDHGTALTAAGAVVHVSRELAQRYT